MHAGGVVASGHLLSGASVADAPFWFWWLAPVVSTAVVVAGVWWSRRDRRPADTDQSVEEYARFRAAFGSPDATDARSGVR
jgi:membrane protein implicated in regulation of membrane protease activity